MAEYNQEPNEETAGLPGDLLIIPSRDVILSCLEEARRELHHKVTTGRIRDIDLEKARNEKTRLLIYCCSTMAGILKERDLDAMEERLAALEASRSRGPSRAHHGYYPDPCTIAGGK